MTARPSTGVQRRIAAQMRLLPRTVEPWMFFTDDGQMRLPAFRHGGFADEYHGWTITYDPVSRTYSALARRTTRRVTGYYRKAEMYKFCRDNSLTGEP